MKNVITFLFPYRFLPKLWGSKPIVNFFPSSFGGAIAPLLPPSAPHGYHCQLTADLNFKSFITFLISAKGTYYFTSKLLASTPLDLYKNCLPFELAAEKLSS